MASVNAQIELYRWPNMRFERSARKSRAPQAKRCTYKNSGETNEKKFDCIALVSVVLHHNRR